MATRQYIGARYVPKFYENSAGTSEWRSGVIYEPLTIVTYNSNSYTSKKTVPASVGDPSANPDYWVATGVFNQQLADVLQELQDMKADIAEYVDRKFLFIGDSYLQGYTPGETVFKGWASHAIECLNLTEGVDAFQLTDDLISGVTTGGWGMAPTVTGVHVSWADLVLALDQSLVPLDEITDIVILGGTNDEDYVSSIGLGMSALDTAIRTRMPNVKRISLGCLAMVNIKRFREYVLPVYEEYQKCLSLGWTFYSNIVWSAHRTDYLSSDGVHLTQTAYADIGPFVAECVRTGNCDVSWSYYVPIGSPRGTGITSDFTDQKMEFIFKNGTHTVRLIGVEENASWNAISFNFDNASIPAAGRSLVRPLPPFVFSPSLNTDKGLVVLANFEKWSGNQDVVHVELCVYENGVFLFYRFSGGLTAPVKVINYNPTPVSVSGWDM